MRVFRIEHRVDGGGCYSRHNGWCNDTDAGEGAYYRYQMSRPGPYYDANMKSRMDPAECLDYYYGFGSLEQFHKWFDSPIVIAALARHDLVMRIFECEDANVVSGEWQVAFKKALAVEQETIELTSFVSEEIHASITD